MENTHTHTHTHTHTQTHTPKTQKNVTLEKRAVPTMSLVASEFFFFFFFFDSAKEASNDATNFWNLEFINTQKPALCRENIAC